MGELPESNRVTESSRTEDPVVSWKLKADTGMVKGEQDLEGQVTRTVVGKGQCLLALERVWVFFKVQWEAF